ncbi:MAG: cation:dicarboxylate symporter family transporter, partial [Wenzhouxiangellaceae bacterium]
MNMILKLVAGIIAGILIGLFAPEWISRLLVTFKGLFGQLLFFTVPLLILFYITSGIAGLPRGSGGLLGRTLATAYGSTLAAGLLAFFVASLLIPLLSPEGGAAGEVSHGALAPFIEMEIPPLLGVMSALVTAFIFGLGITATDSDVLKKVFDQGRDVIEKLLVVVIIPLLPFYIAGIFADMAAAGSVFDTLMTFGLVLVLSVSLHWIWIATLYTIASIRAGVSPFRALGNMMPAYFTALGTMSSAATIPVTLRTVE